MQVYNVTLSNATSGARIKVWPGISSALSGDLQGGGGSGRVSNITYDGIEISNVDYAIEITQCYGQKNITLCEQVRDCFVLPSMSALDLSSHPLPQCVSW